MKTKAKRQRNRTDSTIRNVQAANKRLADLEERYLLLASRVRALELDRGEKPPPAASPDLQV